MFVRVSVNVWYKLEHHTTRRNEYTAGESDFCRFYEIEAVSYPKLNIACSKKVFFKPYEASFWACKLLSTCFLHLLCIQKMFVRVTENFWYKLEHHTTRRNDYTTGESDFFRFYENEAVSYPKLNKCLFKKSFFPNLTRLRFWPVNSFLHVFYTCYAYKKCLLESQETFGTN